MHIQVKNASHRHRKRNIKTDFPTYNEQKESDGGTQKAHPSLRYQEKNLRSSFPTIALTAQHLAIFRNGASSLLPWGDMVCLHL
jgi:hypothetical protein